jgi:ribonuclease P/MRP protein subunit POP1
MRRRPALVQAACEASCALDPAAPAFEGPRRLETHVWAARRMRMRAAHGHLLAWQAPGRGRGSRALLRRARRGAVMHDASYWCCLQLEGAEVAIAATMEAVR